ncbi:hypothetical protein AYB34_15485 [Leptospira sp. ZV016]|nr:hypothetical protein AYB32_16300 [Leptospira kirschneri]KXZ30873.1 hypothetical protein AYB34_15485 [Leptospira sp. ZV016]
MKLKIKTENSYKIIFFLNIQNYEIYLNNVNSIVEDLGESSLPQASRTGLIALVNKLHTGNVIQQSSLDSIY